MRKNNNKKSEIPKMPLFICLVFFGAIFAYLNAPMFNKEDVKQTNINPPVNKTTKQIPQQQVESPQQNEQKNIEQSLFSKYYNPNKIATQTKSKEKQYDNLYMLLDDLKTLPINKQETAIKIVQSLLIYKEYPKDVVKVEFEQIPLSTINNSDTITIAYFDYKNGIIKINELALSKISTPQLVMVIAHELEHFDVIAKVYKSLNLKDKATIIAEKLEMPNIFNKTFWNEASTYANTQDFIADEFLMALISYIKQNEIHTLSIYPYLNQISKHISNKLETRAYRLSNSIASYYQIPKQNLSIVTFVEEFQKIQNKIESTINNYNSISGEEESLFDYFLINTLTEENQQYKTYFQESVLYNNSDMTPILKKFLEENKQLFKVDAKSKNQSYEKITNIIKKMQTKTAQPISPDIILKALEYKINTITNNIHKESTKDVLKEKIAKYINFAKKQNILTPEKELKYIITLLCIENDFYTNNTNTFHSYYSKVPKELYDIYEIKEDKTEQNTNDESNKKAEQKRKLALYKTIYSNVAFVEEKENRGYEISDYELLKELIEENKINIKI